jgi:hypothetical protein
MFFYHNSKLVYPFIPIIGFAMVVPPSNRMNTVFAGIVAVCGDAPVEDEISASALSLKLKPTSPPLPDAVSSMPGNGNNILNPFNVAVVILVTS